MGGEKAFRHPPKKTKHVYFQKWTRVGGKHPQGLLLSLRGRSQRGCRRRSLAWRADAAAAREAPKTEPGQGRGARTCPAGAGRRAAATPAPGGGRGRFGLPPRRAACCGGRRCASRNRWSHTETSKSCRRRPAPARSRRPDPSSHPTERQTRRVPDLSCPACSESVMFGQERGGAGGQVWRPAAAGRGEDPCAACGHLFPAAADR